VEPVVSEEEAPTTAGRLRTYLGIAPGVGKTYAMLRDGRAQRRAGVDVVVAYWERHGRAATAAQRGNLELLPTTAVTYRGATFQELDVDGALERRPQLALVDELAHANLPGQHHAKRWQDVKELLANGIDVYTTLNVSSLSSLSRLVSTITGARRGERVPDAFVRSGEIRLVDLAPSALRRRLAQGLVFPPDRVDAALSNYFRFANLATLRELAQLWMADSVPDPVKAYLDAHPDLKARAAGAVVVGLGGSLRDEWLIRYASDLARLNEARLVGLHVVGFEPPPETVRAQLDRDRTQLEGLGATLVDVKAGDVASGLVRCARQRRAAQLVIGSSGSSRWSRWLKGSTVQEVLKAAGGLPVQVVNVGRRAST
jgi:two-component system, OmpR family, sensor histidine kinase KdpD